MPDIFTNTPLLTEHVDRAIVYAEPKPRRTEHRAAHGASLAHEDRGALLVSRADQLHTAPSILRTECGDVWDRLKTGSGPEVRGSYRSLVEASGDRREDRRLGVAAAAESLCVVAKIDGLFEAPA
jgi:hypothetical protein